MCKEMMMIMFIPVWHSLSLRSFLFYQHLQAASARVHCFISLFYSIQYFLFHSLLFLCARTFFFVCAAAALCGFLTSLGSCCCSCCWCVWQTDNYRARFSGSKYGCRAHTYNCAFVCVKCVSRSRFLKLTERTWVCMRVYLLAISNSSSTTSASIVCVWNNREMKCEQRDDGDVYGDEIKNTLYRTILCRAIRSWFVVFEYVRVSVCVCANKQHMALATQILNSFFFVFVLFLPMVAAVVWVNIVSTERSTRFNSIHECVRERLRWVL